MPSRALLPVTFGSLAAMDPEVLSAQKRKKKYAEKKELNVSVAFLSGRVCTLRVNSSMRVSQISRKLYALLDNKSPSIIFLSYSGKIASDHARMHDLCQGDVNLSGFCVSCLKSRSAITCLDPAPMSVCSAALKQWISLYRPRVPIQELGTDDTLAYILVYEEGSHRPVHISGQQISRHLSEPLIAKLSLEEHRDHDSCSWSASWYTCYYNSGGKWHECDEHRACCGWDDEEVWECKGDILEALFAYICGRQDDGSEEMDTMLLIWPDTVDGIEQRIRSGSGVATSFFPRL